MGEMRSLAEKAREAVQQGCGLPVLGAVARIPQQLFPERHLGLVPPQEHEQQARSIRQVAEVAERYLDLEAIGSLAQQAPALELAGPGPSAQRGPRKPSIANITQRLESIQRLGVDHTGVQSTGTDTVVRKPRIIWGVVDSRAVPRVWAAGAANRVSGVPGSARRGAEPGTSPLGRRSRADSRGA